MIEALDDAVGLVLQKLKNLQLDQNTIIIFLSDNGGATYTRATDNAPLRGGKCTYFDGGLLVPFFIKYPGAINESKVYQQPVSSLDIFTTIAAATQTRLPAERIYDGVNLLPFYRGVKQIVYLIKFFTGEAAIQKPSGKKTGNCMLMKKVKKRFYSI
jgi:arylsulfatase A-like enzyme